MRDLTSRTGCTATCFYLVAVNVGCQVPGAAARYSEAVATPAVASAMTVVATAEAAAAAVAAAAVEQQHQQQQRWQWWQRWQQQQRLQQ